MDDKTEKQPKRPVSDDVDQDTLGQNPQWPGDKLRKPQDPEDFGDGGEKIPLVR